MMLSYTFDDRNYASTIVPSPFGHTGGPSPSGKLEADVRDGRNMVPEVQVSLAGDGGLLVYKKEQSVRGVLEYDREDKNES